MSSVLRRRVHDDAATPLLEGTAAGPPEAELEALRLQALDALRLRCAEPFDPTSAEHMGLLQNLWAASFPGRPFTLPSEEWKQLGFQGCDPRSDLRGCGVTGLKQLCTTLLSHREAIDAVFVGAQQSALSDFPLSIASINTTAMLLAHLHLVPKLALSFLPQRTEAPQEMLHGFLSLGFEREGFFARTLSLDELSDLGEDRARVERLEHALETMHTQLLLALASQWRLMLDAKPETTIMDFPVALRSVHARMCTALRSLRGGPWQIQTVESAFATPQPPTSHDNTPPAWAALSFMLGFVVNFCCSGRASAGTADDDTPEQQSAISYTKEDKTC